MERINFSQMEPFAWLTVVVARNATTTKIAVIGKNCINEQHISFDFLPIKRSKLIFLCLLPYKLYCFNIFHLRE